MNSSRHRPPSWCGRRLRGLICAAALLCAALTSVALALQTSLFSPSARKLLAEMDRKVPADFYPSFRVEPVTGPYNVVGQYHTVRMEEAAARSHGQVERIVQKAVGRFPREYTCFDLARNHTEPYTRRYMPRKAPPRAFSPGNVPRAFWRWPASGITKAQFDAAKEFPGCVHCMDLVRYKIIGGRAFVIKKARVSYHRPMAEEMLKVALALFPGLIPDMEFLLHFGDGCTNGIPAISWNVCRQYADAGFTMPTYSAWDHSLGPVQMRIFHACLAQRYPTRGRKPFAIWRGSTTDTAFNDFTADNYLKSLRVKLHLLARNHTDVLDAKIANVINADGVVRAAINDTGSQVRFEDYNQYCVIIDVDGNGWSDRFAQLAHFNTPILKVASNFTGYFEHLYAPGVSIAQFSRNLSDLPAKAAAMIADCRAEYQQGRMLARHMQATTRLLLDQVGMLKAFAYTLLAYKNASRWEVDPDVAGYDEIPRTCCSHTKLPPEFAAYVSGTAELPPLKGADGASLRRLLRQGLTSGE